MLGTAALGTVVLGGVIAVAPSIPPPVLPTGAASVSQYAAPEAPRFGQISTIEDAAVAIRDAEQILWRLVQGTLNLVVRDVSANDSARADDFLVRVNASAAARTLTLPSALSAARQVLVIRKIDSSVNVVTVQAAGTDLIDGVGSKSLTAQWQTLWLISNGAGWDTL